MTKVMNKKLKRSKNNSSESKNISRESRTSQEFKNQEEFKTQEESLQTRIKIQDLKNQDQDSRLKIQEWRKDSIKISIKKFFQNFE